MKWMFFFGHGPSADRRYNDVGTASFDGTAERDILRGDFQTSLKAYAKLAQNEDPKLSFMFYKYNAFRDKALSTLATDWRVVEFHMDGNVKESMKGGHVIIGKGLKPDIWDLRFRDIISDYFNLRVNTQNGFVERDNLQNVNIAKQRKINYRLLELGHLTNRENYFMMRDHFDAVAKSIIEACTGQEIKPKVAAPLTPQYKVQAGAFSIEENAQKLVEQLKKLGIKDAFYFPNEKEA